MSYLAVFAKVVLAIAIVAKAWRVFIVVIWRPYVLTKRFEKQGIRGPPYSPLYGSLKEMKLLKQAAREMVLDTNSNDITPRIFPHFHRWASQYGETFLYWHETFPRITISDPELVKQILSNKFGFYVKPLLRPSLLTLLGNGLVALDGVEWVRHRRILNPAFSIEKLKVMVARMAACTLYVLEEWKNQAVAADDCCLKIDMNEEFQKLTADIIAHTSFGSSYVQGKVAFNAQKEIQKCCAATSTDIFIPGSQYLPSPSNLQIWKLDREIKNSLRSIIENRILKSRGSSDYGDDLLGLMIEAADDKSSLNLSMDEMMEECKTFFFSGHETTSNLLTWTIFLLSLHQEWQERLREEVLRECGMKIPDADMLAKLKLMNMVLLEASRLYCPLIQLERQASKDMELGELMIPKDTIIGIPLPMIHRNKEYWGEDVNEFNPLRFINGISKAAKHPNALIAFGVGPRACIGQTFAMLEAKTVLALILERFSVSLAPEYKHAPVDNLTLQPQYGVPVILTPLQLQTKTDDNNNY